MNQPTLEQMVNLFKENDYVEIGYIDGIRKVYIGDC